MTKFNVAGALFLLWFPFAVSAQENQLLTAARALVKTDAFQPKFDAHLSMESILQHLRLSKPRATEDEIEQIAEAVVLNIDRIRPALEEDLAQQVTAEFSLPEVNAFLAFMENPDAASALRKFEGVFERSGNRNPSLSFETRKEIAARIEEILGE